MQYFNIQLVSIEGPIEIIVIYKINNTHKYKFIVLGTLWSNRVQMCPLRDHHSFTKELETPLSLDRSMPAMVRQMENSTV